MNLRTSILILGLLCFQLPVFAEHALGTPSEEEPETPETTENPSEAASAILEKLSAGRRSVYSRNVSEALDQLLAEPKERKKLIIDYVEALKGLSAEKREKAVEDFLAKITIRDELDTFFEEARKLPKDPAEGIEKAVLKMKPTDSERLWRYLSKAGQQAAVEKALPEARKNPGMAGSALNLSPEQYAEIIRKINAKTECLISVGPSKQDQIIWSYLKSEFPNLKKIEGLELGALKEVFRKSRMVIAPSTGPLHLAHLVGVPVVGLYSP
ncbi:hypothetical protein EBT16_14760, partial [bacterium]|nr:hypothetical protein [bacterium]